MFGDWRWGEQCGRSKGRFSFSLLRCCWADTVKWRAVAGEHRWWQTRLPGCLFCALIHCTRRQPRRHCQRQPVQSHVPLLALALQRKWETLPLVTRGHTGDTAVTHLHWNFDDCSVWLNVQTSGLAVLDSRWSNSSSCFWNGSYGSSAECLYWTDLTVT